MDCSLPGSSIPWIFQAKVLEWVVISFSRRSFQPRDWIWVSHIVGRCFTIWATREVVTVIYFCPTVCSLLLSQVLCSLEMKICFSTWASYPSFGKWKSEIEVARVWFFVTPWTIAYQAPLSMGFSRQKYWSGLPFPSPEALPDPGIEPRSPTL